MLESSNGSMGALQHGGNLASASQIRRFRRYGLTLPCRVRPQKSRPSCPAPAVEVETQNVSGGGLYFVAPAAWSVGIRLEFELELPAAVFGAAATVRCHGTVTRVTPQGAGRTGIGATIDHYKISPLQ